MTITSFVFILFLFGTLILYYLVPKRFQWIVLLAASLIFYIASSKWGIIYVLVTAGSIYGAARAIDGVNARQKAYIKENKETLTKEQKSAIKAKNKKNCRRIMIAALILNVGILCVLKYCHFAVDQLNAVLSAVGAGTLDNGFSWLVPLGLSFYTFQAVGYIVDVYWGKVEAQRNFFKMLLFVSFFPQVTQGPISEYGQLSGELFREHTFTYENYSRGFQRMLWGFFKKMVIANSIAPYVNDVFANYTQYTGITCFVGMLAYSVQIYADFSGYMDIMCGACEMLDIKLTENFLRPYFSKSIAEYWRRWHISLGTWFKTYIYYPIGVSRWAQKLGRKLEKPFGKRVAQNVPATIALLLVWFTTGLWHGASWGYIVWGLMNGVIIIVSMWLEPVYDKCRDKLHIRNGNFFWRAFRVIRTFLLVTFIKVLPEVGSLKDGFGLWARTFTEHTLPGDFRDVFTNIDRDRRIEFFIVVLSILVLFLFDVIQRKKPIRDRFNRISLAFRIIVLAIITILIFSIGIYHSSEGVFMYANF